MSEGQLLDLARETLWIVIKTSAPVLLVSLLVGLIISIFQTVTSIQEQTLTFVPKLIAIFLMIILVGNWMMNNMSSYFIKLVDSFGMYLR